MRPFGGIVKIILALLVSAIFSPAPSQAGDCCADSKSAACASTPVESAKESLEKKWGVQVSALRLSANGYIVDFRYKVLDSEKASTLSDREIKPFLIDEATGTKLQVPRTPKVGALRQTAQLPEAGKVYFNLFANPGKVVKHGSKVTIVLGDCRVENLTVE